MSLLQYPINSMAEDFDPKPQEYEELKTSIKAYGLFNSIVIWDNPENGQREVIDGRMRQRACVELKIKPRYTLFQGTYEEADAYTLACNNRRHASPQRRALAAARRATRLVGRGSAGTTAKEAAAHFQVSRASLFRAKKIWSEGSPDLMEGLVDEVLDLKVAYEICAEPWPAQDIIVADMRKRKAEEEQAKKDAKANKPPGKTLWQQAQKTIETLTNKATQIANRFSDPEQTGEDFRSKVADLGFLLGRWEKESTPKRKDRKEKTPLTLYTDSEREPDEPTGPDTAPGGGPDPEPADGRDGEAPPPPEASEDDHPTLHTPDGQA